MHGFDDGDARQVRTVTSASSIGKIRSDMTDKPEQSSLRTEESGITEPEGEAMTGVFKFVGVILAAVIVVIVGIFTMCVVALGASKEKPPKNTTGKFQ